MSVHLDQLTRSLDSPMVIVTAGTEGEAAGCLVGFHGQVSIDPLRWCVWISKINQTHRVIVRSRLAAVHFLDSSDTALAELFGGESGEVVDKFARCAVDRRPGGTPVLADCDRLLLGPVVEVHDTGGDHAGVVVEPSQIRCAGPFAPLRYGQVADLTPGHPIDSER